MSHASSHSTTSSKSPSLSRSKAGGPPRDIEDDRERLVRNRLRWLEGNWDGRMPPSKSPPPTAGPKHCGGCRRVRYTRGETLGVAPRWDGQLDSVKPEVKKGATTSVTFEAKVRSQVSSSPSLEHFSRKSGSDGVSSTRSTVTESDISINRNLASKRSTCATGAAISGGSGRVRSRPSTLRPLPSYDGQDNLVVLCEPEPRRRRGSVTDEGGGCSASWYASDFEKVGAGVEAECSVSLDNNISSSSSGNNDDDDDDDDDDDNDGSGGVADSIHSTVYWDEGLQPVEFVVADTATSTAHHDRSFRDSETMVNEIPRRCYDENSISTQLPFRRDTATVDGGLCRTTKPWKHPNADNELESVQPLSYEDEGGLEEAHEQMLTRAMATGVPPACEEDHVNADREFSADCTVATAEACLQSDSSNKCRKKLGSLRNSGDTSSSGSSSGSSSSGSGSSRCSSRKFAAVRPGLEADIHDQEQQPPEQHCRKYCDDNGRLNSPLAQSSRSHVDELLGSIEERKSVPVIGCSYSTSGGRLCGNEGWARFLSLQEDMDAMRKELKQASTGKAAAEATNASVLERARAAEISRDVKEIQIRNLEILLARMAEGAMATTHHGHLPQDTVRRSNRENYDEDHQQWGIGKRGSTRSGGDGSWRGFTRHEPLFVVQEEEPCFSPSSTTTPGESDHHVPLSSSSADSASIPQSNYTGCGACPTGNAAACGGGGSGGGARVDTSVWNTRLKRLERQLHQGCEALLGATRVRLGDGEAVVAAAAAVAGGTAAAGTAAGKAAVATAIEAAEWVVTLGTAVSEAGGWRRAGGAKGAAYSHGNDASRTEEKRGIEEFWGSDYCTTA